MIVHRFHYQSCPKVGGPILGAIWIPDWANCPNNFRRCPFTCWYHFEPSNISENRISCMTNWVQKQDLEQLCILAARSDFANQSAQKKWHCMHCFAILGWSSLKKQCMDCPNLPLTNQVPARRIYVNGVPLHMKGVNWNPIAEGGFHPHGLGLERAEHSQESQMIPTSLG